MELLRRQPGGEESPGRQGLGTDWLNVGVWLGGQLWEQLDAESWDVKGFYC